jgi:DNA-binding response OmpR family regulator
MPPPVVVAPPEPEPDEALAIGDLELDHRRRRVTKGGYGVQISRTPYTLLRWFMKHPEAIWPHEEIIRSAFRGDVTPDEGSRRALRQCVKKIRDAIEYGWESGPYLVNARDDGYGLFLTQPLPRAVRQAGTEYEATPTMNLAAATG